MKIARHIALLALAWLLVPAHAQTLFEAPVGGVSLLLPVPDGFVEPTLSAPPLRKNAETITAPPMRLLAVFLDQEDQRAVERGNQPSFRRYFMVQVLRSSEAKELTAGAFAGVKSEVIGLDSATLVRASEGLRGHMDSAATRIGADSGIGELALQLGVPRQLGVFHETDSSVSTLFVTRVSASTSTQTLERVVAQATSTVFLRGKVVFFAAYSEATDGSDYQWLRAVTQLWLDSALSANRQ